MAEKKTETETSGAAPVEKGGKAKIIIVLVAAVLVVGAAAAGAIFGGALRGPAPPPSRGHAPAASADAEESVGEGEESEIAASTALAPLIVDVRDAKGESHHLKVVLSLEIGKGVSDEELKAYLPRAREAALIYIRSQNFDWITDPKRFEEVRKALSDATRKAVGEKRVTRVVISDFVAQ